MNYELKLVYEALDSLSKTWLDHSHIACLLACITSKSTDGWTNLADIVMTSHDDITESERFTLSSCLLHIERFMNCIERYAGTIAIQFAFKGQGADEYIIRKF